MIYKPPKKVRITTDPILSELRSKYSSRIIFQLFHYPKKKLFELTIIIWPQYPCESTEIYCPVTNQTILKPIKDDSPMSRTFKSKSKQTLLEKAYKFILTQKPKLPQPFHPPPRNIPTITKTIGTITTNNSNNNNRQKQSIKCV